MEADKATSLLPGELFEWPVEHGEPPDYPGLRYLPGAVRESGFPWHIVKTSLPLYLPGSLTCVKRPFIRTAESTVIPLEGNGSTTRFPPKALILLSSKKTRRSAGSFFSNSFHLYVLSSHRGRSCYEVWIFFFSHGIQVWQPLCGWSLHIHLDEVSLWSPELWCQDVSGLELRLLPHPVVPA